MTFVITDHKIIRNALNSCLEKLSNIVEIPRYDETIAYWLLKEEKRGKNLYFNSNSY